MQSFFFCLLCSSLVVELRAIRGKFMQLTPQAQMGVEQVRGKFMELTLQAPMGVEQGAQMGVEQGAKSTSEAECGEVKFGMVRKWLEDDNPVLLEKLPLEAQLLECKNGAGTTDDEPNFDFEEHYGGALRRSTAEEQHYVMLLLCTLTTPGKLVSYAPPSITTSNSKALYRALLEFAQTSTNCVVWLLRSPYKEQDYMLVGKPSKNNRLMGLAVECIRFCVFDEGGQFQLLQALGSLKGDYWGRHLIFGMILGYSRASTLSYFGRKGDDEDFVDMYTSVWTVLSGFLDDKVQKKSVDALMALTS